MHLGIGKEKSPVSFDRLQSSTTLHFLERTPTAIIAPHRDLGLQLAGKFSKGLIDYQLGLWDGTPDGASTEQYVGAPFDFVDRLTFQPFLHADLPALKSLQVGRFRQLRQGDRHQAVPRLASYRTSGRAT